jgi:aminoglycoside phosphotransferase family enzyme/predicted kinase
MAWPPEEAAAHAAVVEALKRPSTYPYNPEAVDVRETHISYVFLAGESAYKLKKPVVLAFLDYGTRGRRLEMCHEEVRLNRRLAPSIYRGVLAVVPEGGGVRLEQADHPDAVQHVVWMRRFDEETTLAARVAAGAPAEADVDALGARLAQFHSDAPPAGRADPCGALRTQSDETFRSLFGLCRAPLAPLVAAAQRFTTAFLLARGGELEQRAAAGLVRDGHGDLRAEHVLVGDTVEVIDCIEFDPALREIDVGADLSFLVMDLERLGQPELARRLVTAYKAHGGDPGDDALVAFHGAHRAWVRAKVALISDREGAAAEAEQLLELGRRFSWRARRPLLLVVCGLSATGKTTLARELGRVSGAGVLSSDIVRKRLAGLAPTEHGEDEHYTPEFSRRTYAELGRLADHELRGSGMVVVDATFRDRSDRDAFTAALGRKLGDQTGVIECVAPPELRAERATARTRGASDATPEVVAAQTFEPLIDVEPGRHLIVRADRPVERVAADVEAWLDARLASGDG